MHTTRRGILALAVTAGLSAPVGSSSGSEDAPRLIVAVDRIVEDTAVLLVGTEDDVVDQLDLPRSLLPTDVSEGDRFELGFTPVEYDPPDVEFEELDQ